MEEADLGERGSGRRLALKALALAICGGALALFWRGGPAAFGTFLGVLAAGFYVWGFLRSHLARAAREKMLDGPLMGAATLRFVMLAVLSVGVYLVGRDAFVGFLVGFAFSFAVLVISEVPRVTRSLKARGMIG